jgi:hypothetical protein
MARTAIIEITRKPTPRMVEALRTALNDDRGIIEVSADKRTHEGLVGRGMADWQDMGAHLTPYCVITKTGRAYLAELDRPETGPVDFQDVTDEEIAEGVEDALKWLPWGDRDEARATGAVAVLAREFKRSGKVWRSLAKQGGRHQVENQALVYYGKVTKLLAAARLREQAAQTQEDSMDSSEQQAPERTGVTRGYTVTDGETDRTPVLVLDGTGERYRLVPFAGPVVDSGHVLAHNAHIGIKITERYRTGTDGGERVAWRVDGHTWKGFMGYQVRTEDRGHGIIAVYVKGSANDIKGIERASRAYAKTLTFAPGCSVGAVGGGGEFCDAGATYISQDTHVTQPLAARTD